MRALSVIFRAKFRDLLKRPIVVQGNRAVLARPIENLDELL